MKSETYNEAGSEFDGKNLIEILDNIEVRPLFAEKIEKVKKLLDRFGYPEKLNANRDNFLTIKDKKGHPISRAASILTLLFYSNTNLPFETPASVLTAML